MKAGLGPSFPASICGTEQWPQSKWLNEGGASCLEDHDVSHVNSTVAVTCPPTTRKIRI